jgi:hypothetical protein
VLKEKKKMAEKMQAVVDLEVQLEIYKNNHQVAVNENRDEDVHRYAHKIQNLSWAIRVLSTIQDI